MLRRRPAAHARERHPRSRRQAEVRGRGRRAPRRAPPTPRRCGAEFRDEPPPRPRTRALSPLLPSRRHQPRSFFPPPRRRAWLIIVMRAPRLRHDGSRGRFRGQPTDRGVRTMTERESTAGRRRVVIAMVALGLGSALLGGVAGGLIVWAALGPRKGGGSSTAAGQPTAVCAASKVADKTLRSVVTVTAGNAHGGSTGSRVVLRSGGYVLTNDHVISVAAGSRTVSITRGDGESTPATIAGRDPFTDLAVIKAENATDLPP